MSELLYEVNRLKKELDTLNQIKDLFHKEIKDLDKNPFDSFSVNSNLLSISLFGIVLECSPRPVSNGNHFYTLEYSFRVDDRDDARAIWTFYLSPGGKTYLDSELEKDFCDFNNTYFLRNMGAAIADALIKSDVFKARSN